MALELINMNYQQTTELPIIDNNNCINDLELTTITIGCKINGLFIDSKELYKKINLDEHILRTDSAFGSCVSDFYQEPIIKPKSNRGRKPSLNKTNKKKHMNSCTSILIRPYKYDENGNKYTYNKEFKLKCFQKESIQIPGIQNYNLDDANDVMNTLVNKLKIDLNNPNLKFSKLKRIQANFKFTINILRVDYNINLFRLINVINHYYENQDKKWEQNNYIDNLEYHIVKKEIIEEKAIKEVEFNGNKSFVMVRMFSPRKSDLSRTTRIEIYASGKVNFKGCHSINYANAFHEFIKDICQKYGQYFIMKIYN